MFDNSKEIYSDTIEFTPGEYVEIYFPEEKIEYRLCIADKEIDKFKNCLILSLPRELMNSFYKGEDFIQCRYVHDNIVYEFGGEILKIVKENNPIIIVKKPNQLKKFNERKNNRISTQILCEYFIVSGIPVSNGRKSGFVTIKDISADGVSFLTTDNIALNSIIKMDFLKMDIFIDIEIKKCQVVNDKMFYGSKIVKFYNNSEILYKNLLNKLTSENKLDNIF